MKTAFRLTEKIVAATGIPLVFHKVFLRKSITVLNYHAVVHTAPKIYDWSFLEESAFRNQMVYLKKRFQVISLLEAVRLLRAGEITDRPAAVITFDDGFQNNYDIAFPILREEGIPATIFLTTGLIGSESTVWFCHLNNAFALTKRDAFVWNGRRFDLSTAAKKARSYEIIKQELKEFPITRLLLETRQLVKALDLDPDMPINRDSPFSMLDQKSIKAMDASNLIEFGAHTHTHAILSRLTDREKRIEIEKSISNVHELTGRQCTLFAYPNGRREDYDTGSIRILQECGVQTAVTTVAGPNRQSTPLMELRRYGIGANRDMAYFQIKVHHLNSLIA